MSERDRIADTAVPGDSSSLAYEPPAADDLRRIAEWNATCHPYPDGTVVHALFDAQAEQTPDRRALIFGDVELTYAVLQERSNRLAHALIDRGVRVGTPVGIALQRSPELIVGMLAILKAGGAYLPLDPAYPADRLALMIEDADLGLILTGPDVVGLPATRADIIDLHAFDGSAYPSGSPPVVSTPDDTMFITFTSGSTGRPKGVLGTHRGMLNRFEWQWQTYPFSEDEVCCQKTSPNFVDHLWETWGPLLKGHALVLIPDAVVQDSRRFADILAEHRIERLVTVPSLMSALLGAVPDLGQKLAHLRYCTLSGERLSPALASELEGVLPDTTLLNFYGMSEASADATWYDGRWKMHRDAIPIGRPIWNMQVYLLDAEQRPVPIGETGELYLGGVGLATGYLGRPDLTEERFLRNPFVDDATARMYRSGDLARWLPEGLLEFVGRVDHQVKIRGVRVELGEVEAAARSLDSVADAVATVFEFGQDTQLVAYVTLEEGASATPGRIREGLASRLPGPMLPARIIVVPLLPLTPHGKVDRRALPDPIEIRPASDTPYAPLRTAVERHLASIWRELLFVDRVGVNDSFFDLGGDSLLLVRLLAQANEAFGVDLAAPDLFEHLTIRGQATLIEARRGSDTAPVIDPVTARASRRPGQTDGTDVAIIGMAGRFPGAADLDELWDNLANGVEGLRRLTDEELREFEPDYQAKLRDPDFVPVVGTLDDVELFDAEFFGIGPGEARTLDPQHRIWFETAWEALENAGYAPGKTAGRIGVYAGSYMNTYTMYNLLHDRASVEEFVRMQSPGSYLQMLNNDRDYLPTRTSHLLDLHGPAVNIQTACSTSLVAVALACRAIASRDCEMALAGGVSVFLPQAQGYFYQEGGIRSNDGHCRPFDSAGTGTLFTSGVGAVLLKGLDRAIADGDTVHAVIRGAAMNNDGAHKASYMAPSVDGQVDVITDAQRRAGVDPGTISYVEAHGTATPLGDPIEVAALTRAFRNGSASPRKVALGSIKSNIGHTDAAAGVAGLIKTVLALRHEAIPPTLHFTTPNPAIDFEGSPFYVPDRLEPWPAGPEPRRAGVSAFGVGGTNAHLVLEEAPWSAEVPTSRPRHLLPLSARTETALKAMRQRLADHLQAVRPPLADVAHTLTVGRADLAYRMSVVAPDLDKAIEALRGERAATSRMEIEAPDVVMMFPGQGSQFVGMGQELYEHEPVYREALDRCASILQPLLGLDLRDVLYPADASDPEAAERLTKTGFAQPAIFAVSYSTALLWRSWGIEPAALVGHSVGEYVAAALAGVFSLQDALRIIAERARLMQGLPGGSMRAVRRSAAELEQYLGDGVSLAAINTPRSSVVSGADDAIARFEARVQADGLETIELHTSHAFHSEMMDPILDQFREVVASVERQGPAIPIVSTLTGDHLSDAEAIDPGYWVEQVRRPVCFSDAVVSLQREPGRVYLEVGPGRTLCGAVLQHPNGEAGDARVAVIDSLGHPSERLPALGAIVAALGKAWQAGVAVRWPALYQGEQRRRVPLPTYPFERKRHWVDPPPLPTASAAKQPAPLTQADEPPAITASARASSPGVPAIEGPQLDDAVRREWVADQLASIIAELGALDSATLDRSASFADLGLDSLFLTEANTLIRARLGVRIPLRQLLGETPTIAALAQRIDDELGPDVSSAEEEQARPLGREPVVAGRGSWGAAGASAGGGPVPAPTPSASEPTDVPVLPNVTRFMVERTSPPTGQWNLGVMLTPTRRLDPDITRSVVGDLVGRHDALRLRFSLEDRGAASSIAATGPIPFGTTDLSSVAATDRAAAIERRASAVQESFDLERGGLIHVELFDLADEQRLLVVAHHFVMDPLSWPAFWRDFEALYERRERGLPVALPAPLMTFETWARALQRYADSQALRDDVDVWRELPWDRVRPIPVDHPIGANTNASAENVQLALSPEETHALLRRTPGVPRKADILVSALASVIADWTGSDTVLLDMMGHGRDDDLIEGIDPTEAVGFFISYTPFVLRLPDPSSPAEPPALSDQTDPLIWRGLGFDLLRYMTTDQRLRQEFQGLPQAQVLFNHHGQRDQPSEMPRNDVMFTVAVESIGETHDPASVRYYPLAVSSMIRHGRLRLNFIYSTNLHERSTIDGLVSAFHRRLTEIVSAASAVPDDDRETAGTSDLETGSQGRPSQRTVDAPVSATSVA